MLQGPLKITNYSGTQKLLKQTVVSPMSQNSPLS